jgi:hypothetical protein
VADISRLSASHAHYVDLIEVDRAVIPAVYTGILDYTTKLSAS